MTYSRNVNNEAIFKQTVYRRIQLAAAVYVIKSTPRDKAVEVHAADLQQKLKRRWLTSTLCQGIGGSISSSCDQYILDQQQNALSSGLHSVISQSPHQNFEYFTCNQRSPCHHVDFMKEEPNSAGIYLSDLIANRNKILANANFIQAVIQLKALAESHLTIPKQQYIGSLSKLCHSAVGRFKTEPPSFSGDSSFQSNKAVASSLVLYIIKSYNADQLVIKSIQAVLSLLKDVACENKTKGTASYFNEAMNQWVGSIYQHAVGALGPIICEHSVQSDFIASCNDLCFSFIRELILDFQENAINKMCYKTKENQILLLLQLCVGTSLWSRTLELIFCNLVELTNLIKSGQSTTSSDSEKQRSSVVHMLSSTQLVEHSYFLMQLVKAFLKSAGRHMESQKKTEGLCESRVSNEQATVESLAGLWRKHFKIHNQSLKTLGMKKTQRITQSNVRYWRQILEESFGHYLFEYPMIAVITYECIQLLPTFND